MTRDRIVEQIKSFDAKSRYINGIVVHCSATKEGVDYTKDDIERWHKQRGFNEIGYHYLIYRDGSIEPGRNLSKAGAHVSGYNAHTIGICYIGGLDENGRAKDTRTKEQKDSLAWLIFTLKLILRISTVKGHRDYSPDKNGNGVIDASERIKECPCFDAIPEYSGNKMHFFE